MSEPQVSSEALSDYMIRQQRQRELWDAMNAPGSMFNFWPRRQQIDQDIREGLGPERAERYFSKSPSELTGPDRDPSTLWPPKQRASGGGVGDLLEQVYGPDSKSTQDQYGGPEWGDYNTGDIVSRMPQPSFWDRVAQTDKPPMGVETLRHVYGGVLPKQLAEGLPPREEPSEAQKTFGSFLSHPLVQREMEAMNWLGVRVPNPIKAMHTSPAVFKPEPGAPYGKFDYRYAGTGEGFQTWGPGHYLTDSPGVTQDYRTTLARMPKEEEVAANAYRMAGHDKARAAEMLERGLFPHEDPEFVKLAIGRLRGEIERRPSVSTYQTNIHAPKGTLIDYDQPFSAQGPIAQEGLRAMGIEPGEGPVRDALHAYFRRGANLWGAEARPAEVVAPAAEAGVPGIKYDDQFSRLPRDPGAALYAQYEWPEAPDATAANARRRMIGTSAMAGIKHNKVLGWGIDNPWEQRFDLPRGKLYPTEEEALKALKAAQERVGSHNYVIFPQAQDILDIFDRYGIALTAPGAAALLEHIYGDDKGDGSGAN